MIEIIGTSLNQWDTGRSVKVSAVDADRVHFANKGDSRAVIMEAVNGEATIPNYLLQTGKQLCVYAVKNGVTVESKVFFVQNRERPENYVYDEDQRNYIYELISKAETAIEGASSACEDAHIAVEAANTAVASASIAVEKANKSADSASLAAKNANEAATKATQTANDAAAKAVQTANEAAAKASHTAKSLMVVGKAEGAGIHLDDAIDQYLVGLRIFGKSTQAGTPTLESPADISIIGSSGSITVDVTGDNYAQRMAIATPNGLPGIPVASGGNYTDENGQQWICDEIDYTKRVHVQRVASETATLTFGDKDSSGRFRQVSAFNNNYKGGGTPCLCSIAEWRSFATVDNSCCVGAHGLYYRNDRYTLNEINALIGNIPITIAAALATPIETPLSEEELAAFAALRTYRGSTTVSNDASAHMEIEYVMDAKKYIDSQIHPAAKLSSVSLPASKWAGSGNLYSQVVAIPGITENSQVNLAPSVEQLAIFYEKDITFVTENDGGVVTIYVIGQKPQNDYTIQADIVEVIA